MTENESTKITEKLGNNASKEKRGNASMAETSINISEKEAKLFDAILHNTPKGKEVGKSLKMAVEQGMNYQGPTILKRQKQTPTAQKSPNLRK